MRFARLQSGDTTVAEVDRFIDLHQAAIAFAAHDPVAAAVVTELLPTGSSDWTALIDGWDTARGPLEALLAWAGDEGGYDVAIDGAPPLAAPSIAVFAIGANFATHAARSEFAIEGGGAATSDRVAKLLEGRRSGVPPWGFQILPRTIVGDGGRLGRPAGFTHLDYEGEVGVVLRGGETPRVWGVVAVDDVSLRDPYFSSGAPRIDEGPLTWVLQKNFRGGTACGPWIVVDEGLDENDLSIQTRVNGELRQSGRTSEMVYSFADVIDHLNTFVPLRSGDLIASGTPEGTAFEKGPDGPYLTDGDEVIVEIEGVGRLRNVVGETSARPRTPGKETTHVQ
jgi:2,4-didehydro-3-deoxy-L-rhamnonate hydrolase